MFFQVFVQVYVCMSYAYVYSTLYECTQWIPGDCKAND